MIGTTSQAIPLTKTEPDGSPSDPSLPGSPLLLRKLQRRAKKAIQYLERKKKGLKK